MKNMSIHEWILLIVCLVVAACLVLCGQGCAVQVDPTGYPDDGIIESYDDEADGLGQPCTPTSGWQADYPDLCCRDDILVTCDPEPCTPTSGWWIDHPDLCCLDGALAACSS